MKYETGNPGKELASQHSSDLAKKGLGRVWSFRLVCRLENSRLLPSHNSNTSFEIRFGGKREHHDGCVVIPTVTVYCSWVPCF